MIAFIQANLSTILIAAALGLLVGGIIAKMVWDKRRGKSACAGCDGCGGCPAAGACHGKPTD